MFDFVGSGMPFIGTPKYVSYGFVQSGDMVELSGQLPAGTQICAASGFSPPTVCPSCECQYYGAPRNPKDLAYHCGECHAYFDIEGTIFKEGVCKTGLMYVGRRTNGL